MAMGLSRPVSAPNLTGLRRQDPPRAWRRPTSQLMQRTASSTKRPTSAKAPRPAASWADAARQQSPVPAAAMALPVANRFAREAELMRLQKRRAEVLERPADVAALLARTDERVPPTCIPEEWHIRLNLPSRPAVLDEYGGRFRWTPNHEHAEAAKLASLGLGPMPSSDAGGALTVFPLLEPYGALDVELLEQWLSEMLAAASAAFPAGQRGSRRPTPPGTC